MQRSIKTLATLAGLATFSLTFASGAQAHVTLDTAQAAAGSYLRIAIRVPHGCDGAATTAIRAQIPAGVTAVKPQLKQGWTLEIVPGATPVATTGHDTGAAVKEVVWRGGNLPDAYFEEFVLRIKLPDAEAGSTIWFPFVQECEGGKTSRWIERPEVGASTDGLRMPAFPLRILAKP